MGDSKQKKNSVINNLKDSPPCVEEDFGLQKELGNQPARGKSQENTLAC